MHQSHSNKTFKRDHFFDNKCWAHNQFPWHLLPKTSINQLEISVTDRNFVILLFAILKTQDQLRRIHSLPWQIILHLSLGRLFPLGLQVLWKHRVVIINLKVVLRTLCKRKITKVIWAFICLLTIVGLNLNLRDGWARRVTEAASISLGIEKSEIFFRISKRFSRKLS